MTPDDYTKPVRIDLGSHAAYNEKWVQGIIASDPSVLGLGDLALLSQERRQPSGGRLDMLLYDQDDNRFEVELQLGPTDESHIIRAIEYWDLERKRYPDFDHTAVLVAEKVTSRFFNVISLFNGTLPMIAIQMQAIKVGEHVTLVFTTVLDRPVRGPTDDDDAETPPTDRAYWENRYAKEIVSLADDLLELLRQSDENLELSYTKFYIGLIRGGKSFNVVKFRPRKNHIILEIRLPQSETWDEKIAKGGMEVDYHRRMYRLNLTKDDLTAKAEFLTELMREAHANRTG